MEGAGTTLAVVQRRATGSVDASFEELAAVDRELSRLARSAGALRFAIALGLSALAKGGYRELGFPSMVAYGLERCERRSRWTEQSLALVRRAAELPLVRAALLAGRVSWSKAVTIARVASPGDEAEWLAVASTLSVKKLQERTRAKAGHGAGNGDGDDDDSGVEVDDEARCTLTVTVNAEEAWLFECASLVVRHLDGPGAPVASVVEAAIRRLPKAAESLGDGKIGFEAARLVTEAATPATEELWVQRAEERTVVHLQEEVRAAGLLTRIGLNGDAEPPSVEMMTALRALEVRVVTGGGPAGEDAGTAPAVSGGCPGGRWCGPENCGRAGLVRPSRARPGGRARARRGYRDGTHICGCQSVFDRAKPGPWRLRRASIPSSGAGAGPRRQSPTLTPLEGTDDAPAASHRGNATDVSLARAPVRAIPAAEQVVPGLLLFGTPCGRTHVLPSPTPPCTRATDSAARIPCAARDT